MLENDDLQVVTAVFISGEKIALIEGFFWELVSKTPSHQTLHKNANAVLSRLVNEYINLHD